MVCNGVKHMILFYSGGSNPTAEKNLEQITIMLSFWIHVHNQKPTRRFKNLLTKRLETKQKVKKGK